MLADLNDGAISHRRAYTLSVLLRAWMGMWTQSNGKTLYLTRGYGA